jgi:long-chain acyl-CoA synthetase
VRARIVDKEGVELPAGGQGELELAGPSITAGYWQRPEVNSQTFHDGWLRTGDGALMDDAGWVYLVDRLKDQIIASGYKVWPREVEEVLCLHPAVREAAVVGKPDDYRGETVVAFVVLSDAVDSSREALIEFVRAHLAVYKAPQEIYVLASLPKTESGKVQRKALRETLVGDPPKG